MKLCDILIGVRVTFVLQAVGFVYRVDRVAD